MSWRRLLNLDALLRGMVAGYGIAIPVGPIGVLILELGIRRGFRTAFSAGAGAASADLIYATVASLAGVLLVSLLAPYALFLHTASALILIGFGIWLFYHGIRGRNQRSEEVASMSCIGTYGAFLGLTLLNPVTVTYFTTLILGLRVGSPSSPSDVFLFVVGAFMASWSWQTLLAGASGLAHKRMSSKLQSATFAVGNCMVIALGILILIGIPI